MTVVYDDFTVTVTGVPTGYTVEAQGPGQTSIPPVACAVPSGAERNRLLERLSRRLPIERSDMERLGTLFYEALFPAPIARAFWRCRAALPRDASLRLKLNIRPPELNTLPWELIFDPIDRVFIAAQLTSPLVRVVESGAPVASLRAPRPLRLLYVRANPPATHPLDLDASEHVIRSSLGTAAEMVAVDAVTPAQLRDLLRQAPGFHILHYDGHAAFLPAHTPLTAAQPTSPARDIAAAGAASGKTPQPRAYGFLALHGADGCTYQLDGERLATFLQGSSPRLVVLAACQTGVDSAQQRFSGIAHQLMRASTLPAVVANQYAISDSSAIAFNQGFYGALASGYPVDAATIEGRKAILERFAGDGSAFATPDWATPVLFMRTGDGTIFGATKESATMDESRSQTPPAGRQIHVSHGNYVEGQMTVYGDQVHGDKIVGQSGTVDADQLRVALEQLYDALGQAALARPEQRRAETAAGNALAGITDGGVDTPTVVENVKQIGAALKQANIVLVEGSALWSSVRTLAPLLGPLVGGARSVAAWFGVAF